MKQILQGDVMRVRQQEMGTRLLGAFCLMLLFFSAGLRAETPTEPTESPVPDAYVARALFTNGVVDHEPVDQVVSVGEHQNSIYFFTDLRNLQGRTITHRWEFEGQFMGEIKFKVGGPRWRVYSKKTLNPGASGKWTVMVLDQSGWPLHASIFMQGEKAPQE
jgi:hypothetical protein